MISAEELAANVAVISQATPTAAEASASLQRASQQMFPREPRRLKQPRKAVLREQLRAAADTIEQQRREIERLRTPWWRRVWRKP